MGFQDAARRASAASAERDIRKLFDNVNQLVKDVKDLKAEVGRLDRENRKLQADLALVARNALGVKE